MKPDVHELLKTLSHLSFKKYGSYSYAAGLYESVIAGLISGFASKEDIIETIQNKIEELK